MSSPASEQPEPEWVAQLRTGDEDAWRAFWVDNAADLLGYCRSCLRGVSLAVLEEVRDEAVSLVFEHVVAGQVLADPRRFAFGIVRNLCLKQSRQKFGEALEEERSELKTGSSQKPRSLVAAAELDAHSRRQLQQLFEDAQRVVLSEAARGVRRGLPTAPLLQWAVIDYEVARRSDADKLTDLLGAEASRVSKLRSAALDRLAAAVRDVDLDGDSLARLLALDDVADIWRRQLVGCPRFMGSQEGVHPVHREDLRLWEAVHRKAVDCRVCQSSSLVADAEVDAVASSYGDAAARRSRI